jgi:hypothetical protein
MATSNKPTTTVGKKLDALPRWLRVLVGILLFALLTMPPAMAVGLFLQDMEIVKIMGAINIFLAVMKITEFVATELIKRLW